MDFFKTRNDSWFNSGGINNQSFTCGYCSDKVASDRGYRLNNPSSTQVGGIYLCPSCHGPSFLSQNGEWYPGQPFGRSVKNVPPELDKLYEEARRCAKENCFTATVLLCRKMLMNIAVAQGAAENLRFIEYVNYLANTGYVPPNGRQWVDHIRVKGNEATHEIQDMSKDDAKDLLFFTEMLLTFVYQFPSMVPQ